MRDRTSLRLLERYHASLEGLAERSASVVAERLATANPDDLAESFRAFVADSLPLYEAAHQTAIELAASFYEVYRWQETGREDELAEPMEVSGTRNGATLETSLVGPTVKVYTALKNGKDFAEALDFGMAVARRTVHTEVLDAAQREIHNQMTADPLSKGWRWKSAGTCAACAAMDDGSHLPPGTPLNRHPSCRCVAEPTFKGVR